MESGSGSLTQVARMKHYSLVMVAILTLFLPGCSTPRTHTFVAPKAWAEVRPGMSLDEVHALLGKPQSSSPLEAQEIWRGPDHWRLIVTYDNNGRVKSTMDYNGLD
jgi:outer membrane protein assembly factor BamE (lipoprotein component of BamABCDE complex)